MAGATRLERRALQNWLLVFWEKELGMVTQQELTLNQVFNLINRLVSRLCVTMKKSARRMASTTSDTGDMRDTSSK